MNYWMFFWNATNLSVTKNHHFCYSTIPTMKLAFILFLCTLKILLYILYYAPHWLTHLIIFWAHSENISWINHTNRITLKQFHPGWNHKTQNCMRRGQKVLYLTGKSFPKNRKQFRVNKVNKITHQSLKFAVEMNASYK